MFHKEEIFVGISSLGSELGHHQQSVYNVFPIALLETAESPEAYDTILNTNLNARIQHLHEHGISVGGLQYKIKIIWTSDLKTFWAITKATHGRHYGCGTGKYFCPYCWALFQDRHKMAKRVATEWNCVMSSFTSPYEFVFCSLHCDLRITEKMLKLTYLKALTEGHLTGTTTFNKALRQIDIKMFFIRSDKEAKLAKTGIIESGNQIQVTETILFSLSPKFYWIRGGSDPEKKPTYRDNILFLLQECGLLPKNEAELPKCCPTGEFLYCYKKNCKDCQATYDNCNLRWKTGV
eukprot:TRINITY_DN6244_c0_g1_i11.p1 TRINITY_DN6244_c0_g1~~TRINITY_DN6244_c0_g1_i11.p1  ORF type:complete len:293 (+),score=19.28 TRINITY_DN6244_c0_g1_i11:788-1666(+)